MDPELKAYLDEWKASQNRAFDECMACLDALERSMDNTVRYLTAPVTASSGIAELVTASAGLADPPALVPTTERSLVATSAASTDTVAVVPATCLTDCAAQVTTTSTTTKLLPWASMSSSSPATSTTNGMVSAELAPDNDDDEHGASLVSSSLDSSPNQFTTWEDASPTAPTSCPAQIEGGHIVPVDAVSTTIVAEVAAPTCFKPEQDTTLPTSGVTTVPVTCSTYGSAHQPWAAPWLVTSSPPTPTAYSDRGLFRPSPSQRITSRLSVHRPMAWPSFMDVQADGVETRPLPWPTFKEVNIHDHESPSDGIMMVSQCCSFDTSPATAVVVYESQFPHGCYGRSDSSYVQTYYAILDAYYGPGYFVTGEYMHVSATCSIGQLLLINSVTPVPTLNLAEILLRPKNQHGELLSVVGLYLATFRGMLSELLHWSAYQLQSVIEVQQQPWPPPELEVLCSFDIHSLQLTNACFEVPITYAAIEFQFLDVYDCAGSLVAGYPEFPVQSPIHFFFGSKSVTWLDTMDGHLLDIPCRALATICWAYSQEPGHYWNNYQLTMLLTATGHRMILARFQNGQKNSHMLLLPWVLEQEELSPGFQFQKSSILPDWYAGNQSIMARVRPYYSLKYSLLADTWRSRLLCVRSVCAVVHAFVLSDGKHSWNWQTVQPAVGRDALLFFIQSVVLKYRDYWWFTTVFWSKIVSIFSARFPMQMEVTCSAQTKLLLVHAYQPNSFGREQVAPLSDKGSETPWCDLLVASSELMWFRVAFVGGQGTFQGGRHMPVFYRHKELRLSWDPGGAAAATACGQGSIAVIAVTGACLDWVPASHDYCFYPNFGYYRDSGQIKDHRLLWDPGGFSVMSAWGQANFQGGRDVRNLSYPTDAGTWAGLMGRHMGLVWHRSLGATHYIYEGGNNTQIIQWITARTAAELLLPPRLCFSLPLHAVHLVSQFSIKSL